jgi:hypothetical protein
MKTLAIVLLLASSASAACFTTPAYFAYKGYAYYTRSAVTEGSEAGKQYKNYREVTNVAAPIKPALRFTNPDGSETVYNPYVKNSYPGFHQQLPTQPLIRITNPDGTVDVYKPRVENANPWPIK